MPMSLFRTLLLSLCAASAAVATPALARPVDELRAWPGSTGRATRTAPSAPQREGRSMPLPQIERRVLPRMGGADYLGPEMRGGICA